MTNRPDQDTPTWYRPGEAAARLGVTPKTVSRMADAGAIQSITLPTSRHRRYLVADVEALRKAVAA